MSRNITMYHSTTTGEDDAVLHSILNEGIRIPDGHTEGSCQRNGFFVSSNKEHEYMQAKGYMLPGMARDVDEDVYAGDPMVITVSCQLGAGCDLDYEDYSYIARKVFSHFQDQLTQIPGDTLVAVNGATIEAVHTIDNDTQKGLGIDVIDAQGERHTITMPWDKRGRISPPSVIPQGNLMQLLRDYLVSTSTQEYLDKEADEILAAIKKENAKDPDLFNGISLKCHGAAPRIEAIEIFKMANGRKSTCLNKAKASTSNQP